MLLYVFFLFGWNYNEVVNEELDFEIRVIFKWVWGCGIVIDYDEIEMIGNFRYELNDIEECKFVKKIEIEYELEIQFDKVVEIVGNMEEGERYSMEYV